MAGYPSLEATRELLHGLAAAGADLIELGLPFSDPLADGTTNQEAAQRALANGVTVDGIMSLLAETTPQLPCPVILFTYLNPLLQRGIDTFLSQAKAAGAAGLIVPDLPPEERLGVRKHAAGHGLGLTFLVAPTSTPERIALADRASTAFLYAVSLRGVTGAREDLPADLPVYIGRVREHAGNPLLIGFGIGRPEQARAAAALSDGVIVASALVRLAGTEGVPAACALARKMREAID